jgi:hypothetical protein
VIVRIQEKQEKADNEFKHPERVVCVLWNPASADGLVTSAFEKQIRWEKHVLRRSGCAKPSDKAPAVTDW